MTVLLAALPLIPLAGAAVLLLGGRRTNAWGHLFGTAVAALSFVVAAVAFGLLLARDPADRSVGTVLYHWFSGGDLSVDLAFRLDQLSVCFALLITGVGTLIHVYSIGYMAHDERRRRFFGYLNLFVASMLLLVLADSYLLLFVGWEGVGLASWLLIGFWNHNPAYATAANKAFIANRIGDVGLILAMTLMLATFGTVDFAAVDAAVGGAGEGVLTAIGLTADAITADLRPRLATGKDVA